MLSVSPTTPAGTVRHKANGRADIGGIVTGATPTKEAPATAARRRAAGIYGAIVTAALMTAAGSSLSTHALAGSVVVTLVVYWLAEEYAHVLGEQTAGRLPTRARAVAGLAESRPMVSASFAPLVVLVPARQAGASAPTAANIGVAAAIVLLTFHGWSTASAAPLRGWQLVAATSVAAALGWCW